MRAVLFIIVFLFGVSFNFTKEKGRWIVDASSQLIIRGSTNVNQFTCTTDCYNVRDTLIYTLDRESCTRVFEPHRMALPVNQFSCGNTMITKDFRETLQANRYPELEVRFVSVSDLANAAHQGTVTGIVEITLAGKRKIYSVDFWLQRGEQATLTLTGNEKVCFSDFDLKAPRKMMGMIQVNDHLEVEFNLQLVSV